MKDSHGHEGNWKEKWTIDAFWELTYFAVFVAICVLWAPSKNSQRYAYSIELSQLDEDYEWQNQQEKVAEAVAAAEDGDTLVDSEYGGKLHDEEDPFQGTGALDIAMAAQKKQ